MSRGSPRHTGGVAVDLDYDNRTGRPTGPVLRLLGKVLPGVREVQGQVEPYAAAWSAHNRLALGRPGRRWLVLGDSMAQGVGASRPTAGWVGQLADRLATTGHTPTLVNLSATGARVRDVIDQQLPILESLAGPDSLVTVLVGSNDLFGRRRRRRELPAAMRELVDRLPPGAVVASLPQPREAARRANRWVDAAAAAGRVRLVDMRVHGPASWRGRLAPDRFHPNDAGYAALADAFEPVARAALEGPATGP